MRRLQPRVALRGIGAARAFGALQVDLSGPKRKLRVVEPELQRVVVELNHDLTGFNLGAAPGEDAFDLAGRTRRDLALLLRFNRRRGAPGYAQRPGFGLNDANTAAQLGLGLGLIRALSGRPVLGFDLARGERQ